MEEWKEIIDVLRDYAGLFALLSLLAAIIMPIIIYRITRKNNREDERQRIQDELDAINEMSQFPMTSNERKHFIRKTVLEKQLKKE